MEAIQILKDKLIGSFYSRYSVGDTWDFLFDNFWLIGHNFVSNDEDKLNEYLQENYFPASAAIDKEYVAKSIIVSSTQRKLITDIALNSDSDLTLMFENSVELTFTTDNEVVDWQWALNEDGGDPYKGYIVGCFDSGKLEVGSC